MAKQIFTIPSRTLSEFRLLPRLTSPESTINNIDLSVPIVSSSEFTLKIPIVSAAMQSVSGEKMAIELAKLGGAAFIFCSQPAKDQASIINNIKNFKAGFVEPVTVFPNMTIKELYEVKKKTGFSNFPVVNEEKELLGLITKQDYDFTYHAEFKVKDRMIPKNKLEVGINLFDLKEANTKLLNSHQSLLPITDENNKLFYVVFRKDIEDSLDNPNQLVDSNKRLLSIAAINTHDYKERVPLLIEVGVDILSIDSSDGHSIYQEQTLNWISKKYPQIPVIGGNIITAEGFDFLVKHGAKAVKVGMGSGCICITQEQKGTGRGLATAIIEIAEVRDMHFEDTGQYIPLIADGGIVRSNDVIIALALGADYVMMGRYFARMDESPTEKVQINNRIMKPYWGEGSKKAHLWQSARYNQSFFSEGIDGFVEYAGKLKDNLELLTTKIKSAMSSCGCSDINQFHAESIVELASMFSIREGQAHDIYMSSLKENFDIIDTKTVTNSDIYND